MPPQPVKVSIIEGELLPYIKEVSKHEKMEQKFVTTKKFNMLPLSILKIEYEKSKIHKKRA